VKDVKTIIGEVEVHKVPVVVEVPKYNKVEKPDYVLVKEEIVYEVPRIEYEDKTYERPILKEKEYEVPVYKEREYIIPKYVEKVYEVPVVKYVEKIVEIPKAKEVLKINEVPYDVDIPRPVFKDVTVTNAVVEDKRVTNAVIKNVTVEAIHPHYVCGKCKEETRCQLDNIQVRWASLGMLILMTIQLLHHM